MKKNIAILFSIYIGCLCSAEAIELPSEISVFLQNATVTEFGTITGSPSEVAVFIGYFKSNWQGILNDVDQVAPDKVKQSVLVSAAENLEPTAYMSFLSLLLDKYQANHIKKDVAIAAFSPGLKKYGFLEYNYKHQSVIALCNRVKTVFPDNAGLKDTMNDILSGEQKKQTAAALGMENRPAPETLPAQ